MCAQEEPLVGSNVEEQNQIMDVDADIIDFAKLGDDESFGAEVQN